jgi:low affinity Fe/Cu permease
MTRRSKVWLVVAVLFTVVNVGGGVFAFAQGELLHAGVHAGLLLVGAYFLQRRAQRRSAPLDRELNEHLTHLEQSIDAIAIEVERIGEGQRFITRLFTGNDTSPASGESAAEPVEIKAPEAARRVRGN